MKYLNITLLVLFLSNGLLAHGGGLNKDGCHNERKTAGTTVIGLKVMSFPIFLNRKHIAALRSLLVTDGAQAKVG